MKGNRDVAAARCDRIAVVQLEGPMETVDRLAGTGSRAAHQAEKRAPVQPQRMELERMRGGRRSQKHTQGGASSRRRWHLRRTAQRREQSEDIRVRQTAQERKSEHRRIWKKSVNPSLTLTCHPRGRSHATCMSPQKWRYACTLLGTSSLKEGPM
jgi:hypothetical protein